MFSIAIWDENLGEFYRPIKIDGWQYGKPSRHIIVPRSLQHKSVSFGSFWKILVKQNDIFYTISQTVKQCYKGLTGEVAFFPPQCGDLSVPVSQILFGDSIFFLWPNESYVFDITNLHQFKLFLFQLRLYSLKTIGKVSQPTSDSYKNQNKKTVF